MTNTIKYPEIVYKIDYNTYIQYRLGLVKNFPKKLSHFSNGNLEIPNGIETREYLEFFPIILIYHKRNWNKNYKKNRTNFIHWEI